MSTAIRAIEKGSVHRITSGQVIVDLQTAVKELLENSFDAGATSVEVRFKEYGLSSIEVVDNGSGIKEKDFESIGLKHHTSKLSSFEDLSTILTFGFRGEALSSLCALCQSVVITTCAGGDGVAYKLELARNGQVQSKERVARQRGTTVTLTTIFHPLPVRRRELERNAKREFSKALNLLHAYALVPCAKGVRMSAWNTVSSKRTSLFQTPTASTAALPANIRALYGPKAAENLVSLDIEFEFEPERSVLKRLGILEGLPTKVVMHGLISKFSPGSGRTAPDRQFLYLNGRPWASGKVIKALNELYRTFNTHQSPVVVLDFHIATDAVDINVTPDKRTLFVHSEHRFLQSLKDALEAHFSQHRATFDVATQSGKTQNSSKDTTSSSDIAGGFDDHESDGDMIAVDGNGGVTEEIWDTGHDKVHSRPVESSLVPDGMEIDFPQSSGNSAGKATSAEATSAESLSPLSCRSAGPVAIEPVRPSAASGPDPSPTAAKGTLGYQRASLRFSSTSVGRSSPVETFSHSTREFIEQAESISVQRPDVPDSDHSLPGPASTLGDSSSPRHAGAKTNSSVLGDSDPEEERPLKKRRSETGGVSTHGDRASSMSSTPAHGMPHDKASDRMVPRRNASHGLKATRSLPEREPSSRQKLRHSIMAFARPGTQVIDLDENEDDDSDPEPDNPITQASHDYLDAQSADEATGAQRMDRSSPKKATVTPGVKAFDLSGDDDDIPEVSSDLGPSSDMESALPSTSEPVEPASRPEIVSTRSGEHAIIRFDLSRVVGKWQSLQASSSTSATMKEQSHSGDALPAIDEHASLANVSDNAKAADALSRVIEKQDFATMDVIGQFNKGFILVRRRKPIGTHGDGVQGRVNDDLFIVDQHAADEKYNFESLQLTTKIDSQKLFQPQYLELTAADELIAVDNLDVLRQNGFEVEVDEEGSEENRPRLRLLAQPVSKSTVFDMKDLEELIQLLHDRPTGQMVRCSKARAMFAMRACRKSVMVGMPLTKTQMKSVIRHMGSMDQPWNCPHGRPTMRHLSDISGWGTQLERPIAWDRFVLPT